MNKSTFWSIQAKTYYMFRYRNGVWVTLYVLTWSAMGLAESSSQGQNDWTIRTHKTHPGGPADESHVLPAWSAVETSDFDFVFGRE